LNRRRNPGSAACLFPFLRAGLFLGVLVAGVPGSGAIDPSASLLDYLRIDTHASTAKAARFLAGFLDEAGIPYHILGSSPENANLVAQVPGMDASLRPLLLLHHMDSVYPPGKVAEDGGFIFGAAALDDKSLGIAHLAAFLEAAARPRRRGILFVAVCGEEKGGKEGMGYLMEHGAFPTPWLALGEGGRNGISVDQPLFVSLAVAEKGVLWAVLEQPLPAGHGATPGADAEFSGVLERLRTLPRFLFEPELLPPAMDFFAWSARAIPLRVRPIPKSPAEVEGQFRYMIHTTMNLTFVRTDGENNVLPGRLRAGFDVRTLKADHHPRTLELLRRAFPEGKVTVTFEDKPAPPTSPQDPAFKRLTAALERLLPGLPKGPAAIPGFTDLRYLRARGVPAVGWDPFFTNYYHESTVHTPLETLRRDRFLEGVGRVEKVVHSLCAE
jgi:acetylornithine deacetylase/succinyl-diaminopimelate desuccinylase-like protein